MRDTILIITGNGKPRPVTEEQVIKEIEDNGYTMNIEGTIYLKQKYVGLVFDVRTPDCNIIFNKLKEKNKRTTQKLESENAKNV